MDEMRIEIKTGAGGPEGQATAAMILRMYLRWASKHGVSVALGRDVERTAAGISSATMTLIGDEASRLISESGVHRVVRNSPLDAEKRRHTSFVSVEMTPTVAGHVVEPRRFHRPSHPWDGQIRSYVLDPYKKVKDLRTAVETDDVDAVFDGDIDLFLDAAEKLPPPDPNYGGAVADVG
jgi:protein subunit release factor B